jgi:hypothetical protein
MANTLRITVTRHVITEMPDNVEDLVEIMKSFMIQEECIIPGGWHGQISYKNPFTGEDYTLAALTGDSTRSNPATWYWGTSRGDGTSICNGFGSYHVCTMYWRKACLTP